MTVNILGCLLIGIFYGLFDRGALLNPNLKLLLTVGFCGGFTTFSTFMNESLHLFRSDNILYGALYAGGSVFIGLLAVFVGSQLIKQI
jgi:CrcB protein